MVRSRRNIRTLSLIASRNDRSEFGSTADSKFPNSMPRNPRLTHFHQSSRLFSLTLNRFALSMLWPSCWLTTILSRRWWVAQASKIMNNLWIIHFQTTSSWYLLFVNLRALSVDISITWICICSPALIPAHYVFDWKELHRHWKKYTIHCGRKAPECAEHMWTCQM